MIARLAGRLIEAGADALVLDVNGVGYLVQTSTKTLSAIGPVGGEVVLLTEMLVREDLIALFGFGSAAERDWFRLLTSVQGVGARVALAILSVLTPGDLARAIGSGDKASIARANGVGPKLAQRIAMELKDRAGTIPGDSGSGPGSGGGGSTASAGVPGDALSALLNLGFRPAAAEAAVAAAQAELPDAPSLDALVRVALRKAAK